MLSLRSSLLDDPFEAFDTMLERLTQPLRIRSTTREPTTLLMDMKENDNEYEAIFNVPGVPKDKVKISMDNQILQVTVEKQDEKEEGNYHWRERSTDRMSRSIRLPDNCNMEGIKAKQADGVLRITIPKNKEAEKKKIINIE